MALITKTRRNLLLIIFFAVIGIFAIRQMGNAALRHAVDSYTSKSGPLTSASYSPAEVKKSFNMATWLRAGVQLIDLEGEERGFLRKLIQKNAVQMDNPELKQVAELVQRNELPLQLLYRAVPLTESSLDLRYADGMELEIPNLLEYLQTSFLLGARWRMEMVKQDFPAAFQTAVVQERIASALTHEPVAITGLIGHVPEKDFYEFLHRNIHSADEQMLLKEIEYLKHLKAMAAPLDRVIAADGAAVYSSMSTEFLKDDYFQQEPLSASRRMTLRTSYILNRPYFLANLLETYTEYSQYARRPVAEISQDSIDQSWIAKMFFSSNVDSLVRRYQAQEAARNLALTAVTTRLHGLQKGAYKKPVELPRSVYTGETAEFRTLPDGSLEISFPKTIKMWDQKFAKAPPERPRLQWRLPPL